MSNENYSRRSNGRSGQSQWRSRRDDNADRGGQRSNGRGQGFSRGSWGSGNSGRRDFNDRRNDRWGDRNNDRRNGYRDDRNRNDRGGDRDGRNRWDRDDRWDRDSKRGNRNNNRNDRWRRDDRDGRDDRRNRNSDGRGWRDRNGRDDRRNRNNNNRDKSRGEYFSRTGQSKHSYGVRDHRFETKAWRRENEPAIPEQVKAEDLDADTRNALRTLDPQNADQVARHLVMAGSLLDVDPEAAYDHAKAAVSRAGRVGVVREGAALAAYACGKYAEALREVRAARRLTGTEALRAVEADCERGTGRPDKALQIIEETDTKGFTVSEAAELVLVAAGARSDLEQYDKALLDIDDFLSKQDVQDEIALARLLSFRADILDNLGRSDEAEEARSEMPALPDDVTIMDLEEVVEADNPHVDSDLRGCRKPLIEACDVLLLDLDGVCYQGSADIPFAAEGLAQARKTGIKFSFVTNNASRTPDQVAVKLKGHGIECAAEEVMTAAIDAAGILVDKLPPGAKVLCVGGDGVREAVANAGFEVVDSAKDRPAAVVQGWDASVGWPQMAQACYAINNGALFVATNLDATLPTEEGFGPGNGSMVKAVEHATGQTSFAGGKPFAGIYRKAVEKAGAKDPLSVGDRLDTDIAGARKAGYRSLHVLTGVSDARAIALAWKEQRPTFLGLDLRDLSYPHPGPTKQPTGLWTVGDSAAFGVDGEGRIYREDELLARDQKVALVLNDYRALVAAVWEARDNNVFVQVPTIHVVRELEDSDFDSIPAEEEAHSSVGDSAAGEAGEESVKEQQATADEDSPAEESVGDEQVESSDIVEADTEGAKTTEESPAEDAQSEAAEGTEDTEVNGMVEEEDE